MTVVEIKTLLPINLTTLKIFHFIKSQIIPTDIVAYYRGLMEKTQKSGQWKALTLKDISRDGEESINSLFNWMSNLRFHISIPKPLAPFSFLPSAFLCNSEYVTLKQCTGLHR
jgi:hypothetical protein